MYVRPKTHRRRVGRCGAAALVSFSLIAAACGDKKDDDAVATEDTEAEPEETTPDDDTTDDTTDVTTPETETTEAPAPVVTEPPASEFEPVLGGKLVVGGEAEVAQPWTPANMQCDSYCHMRARAMYDPLAIRDDSLEIQPHLAESITPNEDFTAFTIKIREGITFHDGTPLDADAAMDNLNRNFRSLLLGALLKDVARNTADPGADPNNPQVLFEKVDDMTFTIFTGKNGNPDEPIPWPLFPSTALTSQAGFMASPTWLAAIDAGTAEPTDVVATGPFVFSSYAPGDRLNVVRNPNYWRIDENGNQLPYLDEIEFRVIVDPQVRAQALESGDVDMIATSDNNVTVDYLDNPDFPIVLQNLYAETNHWLLHLTVPPLDNRDVRCALQQAIDKADYIDVVNGGYGDPANAPFSPGQEGYLADNGGVEYDQEAAAATIADYEAANGEISLNYSATPTATALTEAQFIQGAWGAIGVDIVISQIEQSTLINNALFGDPAFGAFGWRNHAGLFLDGQYHWWHSFSASDDGSLALNFGRIRDPEIDRLLEASRSELDPDVRRGYAEDVNRIFGEQCYMITSDYIQWGIIHTPAVQNIGRTPLPDGGFALDGAGFPGQVWLTAVFLAEE